MRNDLHGQYPLPSSLLWSQRAAEQNKCMEVKGWDSKRRKGSSSVFGGYTALLYLHSLTRSKHRTLRLIGANCFNPG